jgi:hypothetical protein
MSYRSNEHRPVHNNKHPSDLSSNSSVREIIINQLRKKQIYKALTDLRSQRRMHKKATENENFFTSTVGFPLLSKIWRATIDLMTAIALQHFTLEFSESSKKLITWKNRALLISLQQKRSRKATYTQRSRKQESKRNEKPERGRETMGPRRVGKSTLVSNPRLALNGRSRPLVIACVVGSADSATQDPKLLTFGSGFMPEWFGASQVPIQVLSNYELLRLGSLGIWIATVRKEFYFHISGKLGK